MFDEPLSNLDAELRVEMRIEIARLHARLGNTMIYVTHDQTEAMTLADKIVVLRGGVIEQVGSPTELYEDPGNLFVAQFIGSPRMNVLPGRLDKGSLRIGEVRLPAPPLCETFEGEVRVGIRPEHLRPAAPGEPVLPFAVDFTEYLGGTTYLYGRTGSEYALVAEAPRGATMRAGTNLALSFDAANVRLFDLQGGRLR